MLIHSFNTSLSDLFSNRSNFPSHHSISNQDRTPENISVSLHTGGNYWTLTSTIWYPFPNPLSSSIIFCFLFIYCRYFWRECVAESETYPKKCNCCCKVSYLIILSLSFYLIVELKSNPSPSTYSLPSLLSTNRTNCNLLTIDAHSFKNILEKDGQFSESNLESDISR